MATGHETIAVATTAVTLSVPDDDTSYGQTLYVENSGGGDCFLGTAEVTADDGFPLIAGDAFPWPIVLGSGEQLYAISDTSTEIKVLRTGV